MSTSPAPRPVTHEEIDRLVDGWHHDPHSVLGTHAFGGATTIRVLRPRAEEVVIVTAAGAATPVAVIRGVSVYTPNTSRTVNVPFGGALTHTAELPAGALPTFAVRYPEPPTALRKFVFALLAAAFVYSLADHYGLIHRVSGGQFGSEPASVIAQREAAVRAAQPKPEPGTNAPAKP